MTEPVPRLRMNCVRSNPGSGAASTCRSPSTLPALQDIIRIGVGWTDSHLFEFVVGERVYGEPLPDDDFWAGTCTGRRASA